MITESDSGERMIILLQRLLLTLCGHEKEVFEYFCGWVKQLILFPSKKTIMPTFISKEGAGKGTLIEIFRLMLGEDKVLVTTEPERDVWGNFNGQLGQYFLINLNELEKKQVLECQNKLKGLVTDSTVTINKKGTGQYTIKSYHRFIVTTNKDEPLNTSNDDRRNLIIRSSDDLIKEKGFFKEIHQLLSDIETSDVCVKACYEFFKKFDRFPLHRVMSFNTIKIPETNYQMELKKLALSPPEQYLINLVENNFGKKDLRIKSKDLFDEFLAFCTEQNIDYKTSSIKFGVKLANLNVPGVSKFREKSGMIYILDVKKVSGHFKVDQELNEDEFIDFEDDEETQEDEQMKLIEPTINEVKKKVNPIFQLFDELDC
jgi:hypothetical protein